MGRKKKNKKGKKGKNKLKQEHNQKKLKNKYNEDSGYKGEMDDKENETLRIIGKGRNRKGRKYQNWRKKNKSKYDRDISAMEEKLRSHGLEIRHITSDGNCMWRAVSDQLCDDESRYKHYKKQVLKFMKVNRAHFSPFVFDQTFDEYMDEIKKDEEWAGDLELMAVSKTFQVNVIVHQNDNPNLEFFDSPTSQTIHMSYHLQEHYNSVRKVKGRSNKVTISSKLIGDEKRGKKEKRMEKVDPSIPKKPIVPPPVNVSLITEEQFNFITAATGCTKRNYIKRVFIEHNVDIGQTMEFLLMERNIYMTRDIPEYQYWDDVDNSTDQYLLQQQQNMLVMNQQLPPVLPGGQFDSSNSRNDGFTNIDVEKKPKPKKLTKRERKELEKQKRKQEAKERKKTYLTRKQRKEKEKKDQAEKNRLKKIQKGKRYHDQQQGEDEVQGENGPIEPVEIETLRM